ncbi:hypothetical protein ABKN59_011767 [Abortiporus biennis]
MEFELSLGLHAPSTSPPNRSVLKTSSRMVAQSTSARQSTKSLAASVTSIPSSRKRHDTIKHLDKESQFRYSYGSKLHAYSQKDAPYPYAYDRDVLDLWAMDHALVIKVKNIQTFVDFKGKNPKRCLDLGTALGDWVIECAKHWKDCTFVGFDLIDFQVPLEYIDPSIASRIEWVHGNFLTGPLPFANEEFDHIHVQGIAFAVPEDEWDTLFLELHRVLKKGGTIELIQEDAIFPILPKWFTQPLRDGRSDSMDKALFNGVFDSRFINSTPSSILPVHFSSVFRNVTSPPLLHFTMPPMAPLPPVTGQTPAPQVTENTITSNPLDPNSYFMPRPNSPLHPNASTISLISTSGFGLGNFWDDSTESLTLEESPERNHTVTTTSSTSTYINSSHVDILPLFFERSSNRSRSTNSSHSRSHKNGSSRICNVFFDAEESTQIGKGRDLDLFPVPELRALEEKMLYMALFRAVGNVLAVKEAMWEVLYEKENSRKKFEIIFNNYKEDVSVRLSLWHSLAKAGWEFPRSDHTPTAPEIAEKERLRRLVLEGRRNAREDDFKAPVRTIRLLIGNKV